MLKAQFIPEHNPQYRMQGSSPNSMGLKVGPNPKFQLYHQTGQPIVPTILQNSQKAHKEYERSPMRQADMNGSPIKLSLNLNNVQPSILQKQCNSDQRIPVGIPMSVSPPMYIPNQIKEMIRPPAPLPKSKVLVMTPQQTKHADQPNSDQRNVKSLEKSQTASFNFLPREREASVDANLSYQRDEAHHNTFGMPNSEAGTSDAFSTSDSDQKVPKNDNLLGNFEILKTDGGQYPLSNSSVKNYHNQYQSSNEKNLKTQDSGILKKQNSAPATNLVSNFSTNNNRFLPIQQQKNVVEIPFYRDSVQEDLQKIFRKKEPDNNNNNNNNINNNTNNANTNTNTQNLESSIRANIEQRAFQFIKPHEFSNKFSMINSVNTGNQNIVLNNNNNNNSESNMKTTKIVTVLVNSEDGKHDLNSSLVNRNPASFSASNFNSGNGLRMSHETKENRDSRLKSSTNSITSPKTYIQLQNGSFTSQSLVNGNFSIVKKMPSSSIHEHVGGNKSNTSTVTHILLTPRGDNQNQADQDLFYYSSEKQSQEGDKRILKIVKHDKEYLRGFNSIGKDGGYHHYYENTGEQFPLKISETFIEPQNSDRNNFQDSRQNSVNRQGSLNQQVNNRMSDEHFLQKYQCEKYQEKPYPQYHLVKGKKPFTSVYQTQKDKKFDPNNNINHNISNNQNNSNNISNNHMTQEHQSLDYQGNKHHHIDAQQYQAQQNFISTVQLSNKTNGMQQLINFYAGSPQTSVSTEKNPFIKSEEEKVIKVKTRVIDSEGHEKYVYESNQAPNNQQANDNVYSEKKIIRIETKQATPFETIFKIQNQLTDHKEVIQTPVINTPEQFFPVKEYFSKTTSEPFHQVIVTQGQPKNSIPSSKNKQWNLNHFNLGKKLGQGQFGKVYQAVDRETGLLVALKSIKQSLIRQQRMEHQLIRELKIHSILDHPNILKCYGVFSDNENIYMILEYADGGELYQKLMSQPKRSFSQKQAAMYVRQVIDALSYIHEKNIIHRDIKPENILICNDVIKLSDFGCSADTNNINRRKTFCGTLDYVSPELIFGTEYDTKIDVWGVGVLAYELCCGSAPFTKESELLTRQNITRVDIQFPDYFSNELQSFLLSIFIIDPNLRPSLQSIMEHPWISKYTKMSVNEWNEQIGEKLLSLYGIKIN